MNFAVVPAAGRSSRLGRAKALLPFGTSCVLDTLIATLTSGGVERTVVVAAPGDDRLASHCARAGFTVVVNERVADGMLSSIQTGLRRFSDDFAPDDTLTLCPVDFPALRANPVRALLADLRSSPDRIVAPRFRGRRGHPLTLSAALAEDIQSLDLAQGLRALFDLYPHRHVDVEDAGVRRDLDTWLDYLELTAA